MRLNDKNRDKTEAKRSASQQRIGWLLLVPAVFLLVLTVCLSACQGTEVQSQNTTEARTPSSVQAATQPDSSIGTTEALSDLVAVPSVMGDTVEEACRKLEEAGLAEPMIRRVYDDTAAKGFVISQSTAAGTILGRGSVITLTVSRGPEPFTLPDMNHWEAAAAKALLDARGISVSIHYVNDPDVSEDVVLAQDIAAGTVLYKGDIVRLTVSSGKPVLEVADVTGLTRDQAEEKLLAQGLAVEIQEAYDEAVPAGSIIAQVPAAGNEAPEGAAITLIVSQGKAPEETTSVQPTLPPQTDPAPTRPTPTQPVPTQPTPTQPTQPTPTQPAPTVPPTTPAPETTEAVPTAPVPTTPAPTEPTTPVPTTPAPTEPTTPEPTVPPTEPTTPESTAPPTTPEPTVPLTEPTTPEPTVPPTEPPAPETTEASETQPLPDETTTAEETTEAETTASPTTETTREYIVYHFRTNKLLNDHYKKHGIEMGFKSAAAYEKAACDVINNPDALSKREKEDNDFVFYVVATNEFVVLSTDGYIRTYFLPSAGKAYYDRQ